MRSTTQIRHRVRFLLLPTTHDKMKALMGKISKAERVSNDPEAYYLATQIQYWFLAY